MKNLILTVIGLVLTISVTAQISRDQLAGYAQVEFDTGYPMWTTTIFDSTNVGNPIERLSDRFTDGYNSITYIRPSTWNPIVEDGYLYAYTTTLGTTSHIFGAIVYKMDIQTGEILWQTVFDNRNLEKQEYVQSIEISGDIVELVTMKRIGDHESDLTPYGYNLFGAESTVCLRKYAKNSGMLLEYDCWDDDSEDFVTVAPHSEGVRILVKKQDGRYLYLNNRSKSSKDLELSLISNSGDSLKTRRDTMYYPKENYSDFTKLSFASNSAKIYPVSEDTILVNYNYDYHDNSGRFLKNDLSYIQLYDSELNAVSRINLGHIIDMYYEDINNISIKHASQDIIQLVVGRKFTSNFVNISYDGTIISNAQFDFDDKTFVMASGYLEYSDKPIIITRSFYNQYPYELPQELKYYLYENDSWNLKYTQNLSKNHFLGEIRLVIETENKDILICADHGYLDESLDLANFESEMWMMTDGTQLGLKVSTTELVHHSYILIYPNPTTDVLHISTDADLSQARYHVYDILGNLVSQGSYDGSTIDVADLPPGSYYLQVLDDNQVAQGKFVKR